MDVYQIVVILLYVFCFPCFQNHMEQAWCSCVVHYEKIHPMADCNFFEIILHSVAGPLKLHHLQCMNYYNACLLASQTSIIMLPVLQAFKKLMVTLAIVNQQSNVGIKYLQFPRLLLLAVFFLARNYSQGAILLLGLQGSCDIIGTLTKENVDILDVKNGNWKLIFSLFQCSESTSSYSGINKGIQIIFQCLRQKCSIKQDIKFPVA